MVGLRTPFARAAAVMSIVFVASPFYIRGAMATFAIVERGLVDVARLLGATILFAGSSPGRTEILPLGDLRRVHA